MPQTRISSESFESESYPGGSVLDLLRQKDRAATPHRIPRIGAAANSLRYVTKGSGSNEIGRILLPIDV